MHPVLTELLTRPVGWLSLGGVLFMVGMSIWLTLYARRRMAQDEKAERERGGPEPY
ncbi:DUF3149 domain-containing protein [Lysobacter sp. GX 14042]|uniref:DUF3149 domain-containing protein n=1 Tax=Lysobacter sp. GX 14042 TaxID=2907155 RepID=UPI001F368E8A|nr:DUF3149 domain-containing protein [Lysobacter sp. GX 14042]MCE7033440.1 DUF3149 domain-containing protein [Lysobacter sp. GX 14042]